jgi:hypothetical protein
MIPSVVRGSIAVLFLLPFAESPPASLGPAPAAAPAEPAPAPQEVAAPPAAPPIVVNVSVLEMTAQKAGELEIRPERLGPAGYDAETARRIAAAADRRDDPTITVHANVTSPLLLSREVTFTRSIQFPTQSTSVTAGGVAQSGFGGYVPAESSLRLLAMAPSERYGIRLHISYRFQRPASTTTGPPLKTAHEGTLEVSLGEEEIVALGGRLAGADDPSHFYVVVRQRRR